MEVVGEGARHQQQHLTFIGALLSEICFMSISICIIINNNNNKVFVN